MSNSPRLSEFTRPRSSESTLQMWWLDLCLAAVGGAILFILLNYFSFRDPRILHNAWTYLIAVPAVMVLIAMALRSVAGQFAKRSLQLSFLVSVLTHLLLTIFAINVFIFARYWPDVFAEISVEPRPELRTVPAYFQSQPNSSQTRPEYLRPVETEHDARDASTSKSTTEVVTTQPLLDIPDQSVTVVTEQPTLRNRPEKQLSQPSITSAAQEIDRQQSEISNNAQPRRIDLPDVNQIASKEQSPVPKRPEAAAATLEKRQTQASSDIQELEPKIRKSNTIKQSIVGIGGPTSKRSRLVQQPEIQSNSRSIERNDLAARSPVSVNRQIATPRFSETRVAKASPLEPRDRSLTRNRNSRSNLQSSTLLQDLPSSTQRERLRNRALQAPNLPNLARAQLEGSLPEISQSNAPTPNKPNSDSGRNIPLSNPSIDSYVANVPNADASTPLPAADASALLGSKTDRDSQINRRRLDRSTFDRALSRVNNVRPKSGPGSRTGDGMESDTLKGSLADRPSVQPQESGTSSPIQNGQATRSTLSQRDQLSELEQALASNGNSVNPASSLTDDKARLPRRPEPSGSPSLSVPQIPVLAADSTGDGDRGDKKYREGIEAAERSNLARGERQQKRFDSDIADGNTAAGISSLLSGAADVGSAVNRDFVSLGLDPIRRDSRLPEIRDAELETQRFRRSDIGSPSLAAGSVPTPTKAFANRAKRLQPDSQQESTNAFGPETEEAIERGLEFLAGAQNADGSWHLRDFDTPVKIESHAAATALALLSFQGAGYTHRQFQYSQQCNGALQFLIKNQKENGDLFIPAGEPADINAWLYSHAIASLALCEAYGMTQDATLQQPAQRAVNFMIASQDKTNGGWRYRPGTGSDTSVSGWFMMALKSAQLAGLDVPPEVFERLERWLVNSAASKSVPHQFRYNYLAPDTDQKRHGRVPTPVMTSVGLLMRLYLGWQRDDARMQAGADHLLEHPPELGNAVFRKRDTYYWYYGTQVMFHVGGEKWRRWNERLYPILIESQNRDGEYPGSWDPMTPIPDQWGAYGGRLYVTTVNLLSLEVNYRHLPLYESTATEESPTPSKLLRPRP